MPFEKGRSGNPSGRPKAKDTDKKSVTNKEIELAISGVSLLAVQKLESILTNSKSTEAGILKAASKILDLKFALEKQGGKLKVALEEKETSAKSKKTEEEAITESKKVANGSNVISFSGLVATTMGEDEEDEE